MGEKAFSIIKLIAYATVLWAATLPSPAVMGPDAPGAEIIGD